MLRCSKPFRFTSFKAYLILSSIYAFDLFLIFSPNAILSAMLICGNSAYFWNTVFSWRLFGGSLVMSSPPKITFPVFGDSNPPMMRSVVVLPQPLGPKSVTKEFSFTERLKSSRTRVSSKRFEICCKSINGSCVSSVNSKIMCSIRNLAAS